jgi:phytoene desaturase
VARVVVVGAGLGGLSAACHLVGRGHDVTVVEAAEVPGGRAGTWAQGGYRFDTGPTVLTMPHLVERCFAAAGADMADLLRIVPVDPMYRACYADGTELRVRHGREAMTEEVRTVCGPAEAAAFGRFCDWLTRLYHLEMPHFIERNYDSPLDLARPLRPAVELVRLGGFRRLARTVGRHFADDRLRRLFSFQATYAGLAPYEALALYGVITYMDTVNGVVVPVGGMHALPTALAAAVAKAGGELRYGAPVERILLAGDTAGARGPGEPAGAGGDGPVRGVRLVGGEVIEADAVVCNPDLPMAYRHLLPGLAAPRVARRGAYSPSAVVWHVGGRGALPPGAEHHNIHFGSAWDSAFKAILRDGVRMPDPSLLVTVPTLDEPSMAPGTRPDAHVLYVLEPVPNLDGRVDWATERGRARDDLAATVERLGYRVDVEVERLVDPIDWETQGMERGTPFALSHRFLQTGPFRPGNVDARAPGLVFVGSGTVPGVGVPMVLVSGELAADRVDAALGAGGGRGS